MKNHILIIQWATDCLSSKGYQLDNPPEIIQETPWSNVLRFTTANDRVYLKQPAPLLAQEARILQLLANQFNAKVPRVIAANDELHCFLTEDAGQTLRTHLKTQFQPALLGQAIKQFTAIQRSTEKNIDLFFTLSVPDWRLNKLPKFYEEIINQTELLKTEGMTDNEIRVLQNLSPQVSEEFEALAQYQIPETIVQPDFNTNNILINPDTNELTFIDLGEIAISHPFFSLHNFLYLAFVHHGVNKQDKTYQKLLDACLENWLKLNSQKQLMEAFRLAYKLWPVYSAIVFYHFMHSVDLEALKSFYAHRRNQLAKLFRQYLS